MTEYAPLGPVTVALRNAINAGAWAERKRIIAWMITSTDPSVLECAKMLAHGLLPDQTRDR